MDTLFATTSSVAATLIAIIGGFLASRVLAGGQDRRAATAQAKALRARLKLLSEERDRLARSLLEEDVRAWLEEGCEVIVGTWGQATLEEAVEFEPWARPVADLDPYFSEACRQAVKWQHEFEGLFVEGEPPPPDLEEIIDLRSLSDLELPVAWMAFIRLTNEFASKSNTYLTIPFSKPKRENLRRFRWS